ncbi:hypothetical protein ACLB2K_077591 [Fragaria x ananassa]
MENRENRQYCLASHHPTASTLHITLLPPRLPLGSPRIVSPRLTQETNPPCLASFFSHASLPSLHSPYFTCLASPRLTRFTRLASLTYSASLAYFFISPHSFSPHPTSHHPAVPRVLLASHHLALLVSFCGLLALLALPSVRLAPPHLAPTLYTPRLPRPTLCASPRPY